MRAQIIFVAMFGVGVASVGCSSESAAPGGDSADVTARGNENETPGTTGADSSGTAERLEYVCELPQGRIVEVHPSYSELHRIDLNAGTWQMDDGLSIESTASGVTITSDEGDAIATIDKNLQFKEGDTTGTCKLFGLKELKPTSEMFSLDDTLEYECRTNGGVTLIVQPKFGEIDEINVNAGKYSSHDGISFDVVSLETNPPKTEINGVDEEGTPVATITEDDRGVSITMGDLSGSCEKLQRTKK